MLPIGAGNAASVAIATWLTVLHTQQRRAPIRRGAENVLAQALP